MRKWILPIIMIIFFIQIVQATICEEILTPGESCEMLTPYITCSNYVYDIYNASQNVTNGTLTLVEDGIYKINFNLSEGDYIVKLCDGATREIIVEYEDDNMTGLAITLFILSVAGTLIFLPLFKKEFHNDIRINLILKRASLVIGIFLMSLNTKIVAQLAFQAGLTVKDSLLNVYAFIFGWGGYILIFYIVLKTFFELIKIGKQAALNERMGEEQDGI